MGQTNKKHFKRKSKEKIGKSQIISIPYFFPCDVISLVCVNVNYLHEKF